MAVVIYQKLGYTPKVDACILEKNILDCSYYNRLAI